MTRELDDENTVRDHDAHHHHHAHQRHDVESGLGGQQEKENTGEAGRDGEKDDEWVGPRGELSNKDKINEHDGENQANPEAGEGRTHALHRSAEIDAHPFREIGVLDDVLDLRGDLAEIFLFGRDVEINDAEELVVVDFRRRSNGSDADHRIEIGGLRDSRAAERNIFEIRHGFDGVLGVLDGQEIGVAAFGVNPIVGGDHAV